MLRGALAQNTVGIVIERDEGRSGWLEPDQIEEVDVIEIELEVAAIRVRALAADRRAHGRGVRRRECRVHRLVLCRIYVPPDLEQRELLVRTAVERRRERAVRHLDTPAVRDEIVEESGDERRHLAAERRVGN